MNNNIQCSIESSTTSMELNSAADGIYLVPELEGLAGLPEIRTTSGVNAGYDGGWTSAQNYDARLIAIRGVIASRDVAQVEAQRRKLASLLGQGRKEQLTLHFTTEAGNAYAISVRTISCEMALQRVLNKQDFLIQLRADDPLIYDDGTSSGIEAILRVRQALGGFQINFNLPLEIGGGSDTTDVENGQETVYPIISLYGPLHSPTVVNMTTNQQMQVIADLGYTISWSGLVNASGEYFSIANNLDKEAPMSLAQIDGNTTQDGTPTPSAPVPVETVTGRQTVTVAGKNLLRNAYQATQTINGVTITSNADGTITANGTATGTINFFINGSNTQYNISAGTYTLSTGTNDSDTTYFMIVDKSFSGEWSSRYTSTRTITVPSGGGTIAPRIVIRPNATLNNVVFKPMAELGNQATTFEPYKAQEYEINLGKNLINTNIALSRDYLDASGNWTTGTQAIFLNDEWGNTPSTSYTFTASERVTNSAYLRFCQYKADGTFISRTLVSALNQTITTTPECYKVAISLDNASGGNHFVNPQLEKGSTASSYSAYFEPIELCKIGTYQDRIHKENGKWWLHKEIGRFDITGAENWIRSGRTTSTVFAGVLNSTSLTDIIRIGADGGLSNRFIYGRNTTVEGAFDTYNWSGGIAESLLFCLSTEKASDVASFKTWLANNPTVYYYVLTTPTTTEITNEEVLEGLEAAAGTLNIGENNIFSITAGSNATPTLTISYATRYTEQRDTIVIDSQARTITLNGVDAYHLKTDESEFPVLAPGTNEMYLTSATTSDSGYAEVKFKQGHLSI